MNRNHNVRSFLSGLVSILVFFSGSSYAEDNAPLLDPVRVTEQGQRADTVTVVDREEIRNKHSTVAFDVLENQPGLHVVRRLGFTGSGLSRLTIRGNGAVGPAGVQVFVDGRPDATVSFAHPQPSALSLENVERIEVIHGPSPVLHGSGKTGVVNITTADPEPGLHSFLEARYGSFDTTENFARVSYGGDDAYGRLSGSYRSTDGDNPESSAHVKSFNFKGGYRFNNVWDATVTAGRNKDSFDVFNAFFVPGPFTDPRTDSLDLTQTVLDFTLNANFGNVLSSLKFFYDDLEPRSQVLDDNLALGLSEERADINEKGLRFKTTWAAFDNTTLIGGVDFLRAEADNSPVLPPFGGPLLGTPRARVNATLRELGVYGFVDHSLTQTVTLTGGVRFTDHSEYSTEVSGEAGILWQPVRGDVNHLLYGTTFRARATRGFQSPTLQQLFGIFRGGQGGPANSNLQPEIVKQYEIGFNKVFSKGSFDLVAYIQDGDGLISMPATPPPPPPDIGNDINYVNRGVEAKLHYQPTENWDTSLGITVADFEDRFLRVPENTVDIGVTYYHSFLRHQDFSITLSARYADDIFDIPVTPPGSTLVELDNYFVADVKINYQINNFARAFVEVDNITNEDFELVAGIPANSIGVFAGFALNF